MKKEDIKHLSDLARLELTDEEIDMYVKDIPKILDYVDTLKTVKTNDSSRIESAGVRNVFREDDSLLKTGTYSKDILDEAPDTQDGFIKVKKILNNGSQ